MTEGADDVTNSLPSFKQKLACRLNENLRPASIVGLATADAVATPSSLSVALITRLLLGDGETFSRRRIFMSADAADHPRRSDEDSSACSRALDGRPAWARLALLILLVAIL